MRKQLFASKWRHSIRIRGMALSVAISLITSVVIGFYLSVAVQSNAYDEEKRTHSFNLRLAMEEVDAHYVQIKGFISWCATDEDIQNFLNMPTDSKNYIRKKVDAHASMYRQLMYNSANPYILRAILVSPNLEYIQVGNIQGSPADLEYIHSRDYHDLLLQSNGYYWLPIQSENFAALRKKLPVIPICRPIKLGRHPKQYAELYISASTQMLTDEIDKYVLKDRPIFVEHAKKLYEYQQGNLTLCENAEIHSQDQTLPIDTKVHPYVHATSHESEASFFQILSPRPLFSISSSVSIWMIILLVTVELLIIWYMMQRFILMPITRISRRITRVASGDLSKQFHHHYSTSEFGIIEAGIDRMTASIDQLMTQKVQNEKVKRELELNVLQNQINPHFIYNTLNTIKWMATLQGNQGIGEVATSLGTLLHSLAHDKRKYTTIQEELAMLHSYMIIQQYRYGNMVSLQIDVSDEISMDTLILRLLIQPLIENAIFHGTEPKGVPGHINVCMQCKEHDLQITVQDDGVGISVSKIEELLSVDSQNQYQKNVGVKNVHMRLQCEFGTAYGLTIQSKEGKGTTITLLHPLLEKRAEECTES